MVRKSLLRSTDSQSLQPDEGQAEKEHNSEPSHGLEDCPNIYEASPAEARNEELCLESNSEYFTGESHMFLRIENVTSLKCTDDPAMESHQSSDTTQPQPMEQDERQVRLIHWLFSSFQMNETDTSMGGVMCATILELMLRNQIAPA